jgi:general secretion pathway protein S
MFSLPKKSLIIVTVLLSGCSGSFSDKYEKKIPLSTQVNQLSAFMAGSQYLRDYCYHSDIGSDNRLNQQVLKMAENRGWDISKQEYLKLNNLAADKKQLLLNDPTASEIKCIALSSELGTFHKK